MVTDYFQIYDNWHCVNQFSFFQIKWKSKPFVSYFVKVKFGGYQEKLIPVVDDNSHKTWNSTWSSKTRSSNTRSSIDTGRASTTSVDENEGQCPEVFYLYC